MPIGELLTVQEAAELLGVRDSTVRHAIRDGRLQGAARVGKHGLLIQRDEVERYGRERRNSGKPYKRTPDGETPNHPESTTDD